MTDYLGRRRSVDVGGLALALADHGCGHGWGGWEETDSGETRCVFGAAATVTGALTGAVGCVSCVVRCVLCVVRRVLCLVGLRCDGRYAEVLIDVRMHTETIVSQELDVYVCPFSSCL